MKYAFVDLDETLIHSDNYEFYAGEPNVVEMTFGSSEKYYVMYRNGAREFLAELRKNCDKVFMLTIAVQDYAEAMNETFNLGFDKGEIYSRYDIRRSGFSDFTKPRPDLIPGDVFLFDNLHYYENREKTLYLEPLGKLHYVKVREFYGYGDMDENLISQYLDKVKNIKNESPQS